MFCLISDFSEICRADYLDYVWLFDAGSNDFSCRICGHVQTNDKGMEACLRMVSA